MLVRYLLEMLMKGKNPDLYKALIALVTCSTSRAVYLYVAADYSEG